MSHQRSLSDYLQRTPSQVHTPTPSSPLQVPSGQQQMPTAPQVDLPELPQALTKVINELAIKYAAVFCNSINLQERINSLNRNKEEGTIPQHMAFKFKNLFTKENETNLRSTMITISIDTELTELQSKFMENSTKFDNRLQDLEQTVTNPLNQCRITIPPNQIVSLFEKTLQNRKLEFILKQDKDKAKKQAKKDRLSSRQEVDNEIATLSNRQVSKLQKEIKDLKTNLAKIKVSASKTQTKTKSTPKTSNNKSKNAKGRQVASNGKKKRDTGKRPSTTRNN